MAGGKITANFRSSGDANDNTAIETFWASGQREIEFFRVLVKNKTHLQMRTINFEYVEIFYNREPYHAGLGHRTNAAAMSQRWWRNR